MQYGIYPHTFLAVLRIRIQSGPWIGIRIQQVKLSYKKSTFQQIFHDFQLFLKMIPNKSSLFNKIN